MGRGNPEAIGRRRPRSKKRWRSLALNHYANAAQLIQRGRRRGPPGKSTAEDSAGKSLEAQVQALAGGATGSSGKASNPFAPASRSQPAGCGRISAERPVPRGHANAESAATAIDAEYNKFADDKGFHELWLQAVGAAGIAREREGAVAPADVSLALLDQSASDYRSLAGEIRCAGRSPGSSGGTRRPRHRARGRGRAGQRRQVRCPARSGGAGVSQRARGAHQNRSAPGMGYDARRSRGCARG